MIAQLEAGGLDTMILSGDAEATTKAVAGSLGARQYQAEVKPGDKQERLAQLQRSGYRVTMVGDGVNDSPALAQAHLAIAMGSRAALAMEAAHVVLMTTSLSLIPATFDLARQTMRTIRLNLFWAFFYNTAGISLAAAGLLNPLVAAGAMILSSLSVTVQSARPGRWEPPAKGGLRLTHPGKQTD